MRTPITLKIKFKSNSLDQFIERYSVDVSRGGIFIRTKEPLPVGTTLRFEFQLQDGSSLIGGEGTVVWNRAYDPARTGVAPGMGVRFDKLTADSQRVLDRILGEKHKRGEAQLESRFDAGVRASREARGHDFPDTGTPLPAPAPGMGHGFGSNPGLPSPAGGGGGQGGSFGDEPTRMMAADQVHLLAERMQQTDEVFNEDQPTRRATLDEIRRVMADAEATPSQPPAAGRTGRTGELRPGAQSGAARLDAPPSRLSTMGLVNPALQAAATPTRTTEPKLAVPSSLATRPVSPEEAEAMVAASLSATTPRGEEQTAPPARPLSAAPPRDVVAAAVPVPVEADIAAPPQRAPSIPPAPPAASAAPAAIPTGDFLSEGAISETIVDAPAPLLPMDPMKTLAEPPPAESLSALLREAGAAEAAPAADAVPSGISIGVDIDLDKDAAQPLNPQDFAPPTLTGPAPSGESRPPQDSGSKAVGAHPVSQPPTPGGSRTPWLVILLGVVVIAAGAAIYGLMSITKPADDGSRPTPEKQQVKPTPEVKPTPPPEVKPTPPPEVKPTPPPEAKPTTGPGEADKPEKGEDEGKGEDEKGEDKRPAGKAEDKSAAQVLINSEPPGAKVEIAGAAAGTTPAQLKDLQPGKTYEGKVSLRGYQDAKIKVKVQTGENKPVTVKLVPVERLVEVNSTPRNAEVFLDGKKVGRTPITLRRLDLSKVHEIEVRKTGHQPQTAKVADTDTFDVKNGKEVRTLNLTLEVQGAKDKAEGKARPETRPAAKPETRNDDKAEGKADKPPARKKPERPDAEGKKPDKAADRPEARPEAKPEARSDDKAEDKDKAKAEDKAPAPAKDKAEGEAAGDKDKGK
jgi:uncharacterized protein (TIGR02266 family)